MVFADVLGPKDSTKMFWESRHIRQAYGDWSTCLRGAVLLTCGAGLRRDFKHPAFVTIQFSPTEKKTGVVYDITCNDCGEYYIGETARTLEKRLGEHQKQTTSAIQEHQSQANHEIDWEGVKILDKESVDLKRKIKEAIHIRRQRPTLNRDRGYDLPAIFDHLLSRD